MAKKAKKKLAGKKTAKKSAKKAAKKTAKKPVKKPVKKTKAAGAKSVSRPAKAKTPKPRASGGVAIASQHVDFMTYKVDQLRKFYEGVLDLPIEIRDTEGLNYLLVRTSPQSTLGFMPPHPDMRGEQPQPREPTLYFEVPDVDRAHAKLTAKGAAFAGPPREMPWGDRVVTTTDPEGRTIMLASKVKKRSK